jgi:hypothetical protein
MAVGNASIKKAAALKLAALVSSGSPRATLFITVLFLQQLTEDLQYQRVIKEQAVPWEAEAVLHRISQSPPDVTTHHRVIRANTPQPRYSRV